MSVVWKSWPGYTYFVMYGSTEGFSPCQEEDVKDRHERHQLVPSCCKKPQKSPSCLHWTQRGKENPQSVMLPRKKQQKQLRKEKTPPTWSWQEQQEQREKSLQRRPSPRSQSFTCSHHTVSWLKEAVTWTTKWERKFNRFSAVGSVSTYNMKIYRPQPTSKKKTKKVLFNLRKLGRSTVPPPAVVAWRTVRGGRCVSLNAASLYSHHLCMPQRVGNSGQQKENRTKRCVNEWKRRDSRA